MKIKSWYFYLFYKIYKFSESAPSVWLSDFKASLIIDFLLFIDFTSCLNYYTVFFDPDANFGESNILFYIGLIIVIFDYIVIYEMNNWKQIVKKFDALPRKTNIKGSWIVLVVILLQLFNFIYSFYLLYTQL